MSVKYKRDQCSILSLVLKGKWYDMIDRGEKVEEYRDFTGYWHKRLMNWLVCRPLYGVGVVEFRRGYGRNAPRMYFHCFAYAQSREHQFIIREGSPVHPEWGEPKIRHFVICLGPRVEVEL